MRIPQLARRRREIDDDAGEQSRRSFATTLTLLVVTLVIACVTQLGGNPDLTRQSGAYGVLWPQGWAFFTGVGTKDQLSAYRIDPDNGELVALTQRVSWSDRQWGLERSGEPQAWEISDLAKQVPQDDWSPCAATTAAACLAAAPKPTPPTLTNWSAAPTLCGPTVIAIEHPSYPVGASLPSSPRHIYAATEVNLTCRS